MDINRSGADSMPDRSIGFRLSADRAAIEADVRLRRVGDRWISISVSAGREVTGIGSTARMAIVASLDWLGPNAVRELLADLRLLDVSVKLTSVSTS